MSDLIDRQALKNKLKRWDECDPYEFVEIALHAVDDAPAIDAVPVKFIDDVIEYLTKCRDYAIREETKTTWDEQRHTLIMLLHEWAAWNECGRTGKYGERRANDEAD